MITAIVMIDADVDAIPELAQRIADQQGVREVYSVTGDTDLIALVDVQEHEEFTEVIAHRLNKTPGVRRTRTHIAFRQYSSSDLDEAFSLGLD
ncbi:hypothetical protein KEM60_02310 [Austwickia sp. TVS 96-490-7B]|uniref:Lrp/AsnC family transcriptional regulator n=1 Tax=Austwickia sp. TVS 96-490-7B TaxID=2830843 RepID=UPI001C59C6BB|nr:Lrp/AsnC ligand binding domain-containing protein [Austwickia sp. TVS 96-490-7B]MBW3086099.1 hypothetical protein [Austwickia sp. TVS 96-490-7B]